MKRNSHFYEFSRLGINAALESMGAAIPVKLSAYYFFPIRSRMKLYLKGGIGCYFGNLTYDTKLIAKIIFIDIPAWEKSVNVKDKTIGLDGGIGFEYDVLKNIGLFVEGAARYAKLKDWKGDEIYIDAEGQTDNISGTLWFCETLHEQTGIYYPDFKVSRDKPSSDGGSHRNIRKAEIDFSGFSLRFGLRIKF